jgi:two-component system, LytTR family, sensor kinase
MMEPRLKPSWLSFWKLQLAGWLAYGVMIFITFLTVTSSHRLLGLLHIKGVRTVIGFLLTCVLRYVYRPAARTQSFRVIASMACVGSLVFGCLWPMLYDGYGWLLNGGVLFDSGWWQRFPKLVLDYAMTLLAWSALYFGIKYWQAWETERERSLQSAALAQQAQLEMLRYQLNPHFLFNALNSIRASIDEDSQRAKRMITEFSEFLRYSLLNTNAESIPLREELEAIRNYLAIEQIRFEDKLAVSYEIEPAAEEFRLPGFLVYPLVENALKHGMEQGVPLQLRLHAAVRNDALTVEVANTGQWQMNGRGASLGIGLRNVRERLAQLFPERSCFDISAEQGWVRAVIEIRGNGSMRRENTEQTE